VSCIIFKNSWKYLWRSQIFGLGVAWVVQLDIFDWNPLLLINFGNKNSQTPLYPLLIKFDLGCKCPITPPLATPLESTVLVVCAKAGIVVASTLSKWIVRPRHLGWWHLVNTLVWPTSLIHPCHHVFGDILSMRVLFNILKHFSSHYFKNVLWAYILSISLLIHAWFFHFMPINYFD
jgi:hypothetical protein